MNIREQQALLAEIKRRAKDYDTHDFKAERQELIDRWRAAYPDCVNQPPSQRHRPLIQIGKGDPKNIKERPEQWANDIYFVMVRRWPDDKVFGSTGGMTQIGIHAHDGTARHDWREFQWIKNQLAGEECEAFELYPAESRLLDPSNYFTIWCFPGVRRIKVGADEPRRVWDADEALAPQRGFEK